MDDWSMPMPGWQDDAPTDVGNLESTSSTKKLAKLTDVCGKVATEVGGSRFPILGKMVPFVTKSMRTEADLHEASMNLDEGSFAPVAWEVSSATNNFVATAISLAGASQLFLTRQIEQSVMTGVNSVLLSHIASHSGMSSIFWGVMKAEPFITPLGAWELRSALGSEAARKIVSNVVKSTMDGAPAVMDMVSGYRALFNNLQSGAFFPTPEFPSASLETSAQRGLERVPGHVSDARRLAPIVRVGSTIASNILPPASMVLDGYGLSKTWAAYGQASDQEAKGDALAALLCSSLVMVGSTMNAVGMNTRIGPLLRAGVRGPMLALGLGLMVVGSGGSYFMEEHVARKAADKSADKARRSQAQRSLETKF